MKSKRAKIPLSVLERAKVAVEVTPPRRSAPRPVLSLEKQRPNPTRAKVIKALAKLHPMD